MLKIVRRGSRIFFKVHCFVSLPIPTCADVRRRRDLKKSPSATTENFRMAHGSTLLPTHTYDFTYLRSLLCLSPPVQDYPKS